MAAWRPQLHDLEQTNQNDGYCRDNEASLRKCEAYGKSNQNEGEGVFAILPQRGVRAVARRPERREYDRRDQKECAHAEESLHYPRIARFAAIQRARKPCAASLLFVHAGIRRFAEGFGKLGCFGNFLRVRVRDRMDQCGSGAAERSK
jgi:hypothetical protein